MATATLHKDSDDLLILENLKDELEELRGNSAWVNNATVEATVYESDGTTEVGGQSWPVTMQYLTGSDGTYYATLEDGIDVAINQEVIVEAVADAGGDITRAFTLEALVESG